MSLRRSLGGYVVMEVQGSGSGRFFNLCVGNGICLWDIRAPGDEVFLFSAARKDVWRMHPYLRKCRVRIRIVRRCGIWFRLFAYRRRIIFPLAIAAFALLLHYAGTFVWKIDISGNSCLTTEALMDYLKSKNAGFGAAIKDIDCDRLELSLRKDFAQVIWASVSVKGTDLVVELQEKAVLPGQERADSQETSAQGSVSAKSRDIRAACDGVVVSIITRRGMPKVKAGTKVKKGQILVKGRQDIVDDNGQVSGYYEAVADADICGQVAYPYKDVIFCRETTDVCTGEQLSGITFDLFGKTLSLPLGRNTFQKWETRRDYYQLHLTDWFYLPLSVEVEHRCRLTPQKQNHSFAEAKQIAKDHLSVYLTDLKKGGVAIKDYKITMKKENDRYRIEGKIIGQTEIGERK